MLRSFDGLLASSVASPAGEMAYEKLLPDRCMLDHPYALRKDRVEERCDKTDRK